MGNAGAVIFLGVAIAVAVIVWGAFKSGRSVTIAIVALFVAVLSAGCGWYAFVESQSVPWTVGYGVVSLVSLGVGLKNLTADRNDTDS